MAKTENPWDTPIGNASREDIAAWAAIVRKRGHRSDEWMLRILVEHMYHVEWETCRCLCAQDIYSIVLDAGVSGDKWSRHEEERLGRVHMTAINDAVVRDMEAVIEDLHRSTANLNRR